MLGDYNITLNRNKLSAYEMYVIGGRKCYQQLHIHGAFLFWTSC